MLLSNHTRQIQRGFGGIYQHTVNAMRMTYHSTSGIILIQNMYHMTVRDASLSSVRNKQTNKHTDTQLCILVQMSFVRLEYIRVIWSLVSAHLVTKLFRSRTSRFTAQFHLTCHSFAYSRRVVSGNVAWRRDWNFMFVILRHIPVGSTSVQWDLRQSFFSCRTMISGRQEWTKQDENSEW